LKPRTNANSDGKHILACVGLAVAFVLVFSIVSTIAPIGSQSVFAEKGGKSHDKGEKSKERITNQTQTTSKHDDHKDSKKANENGKIKERSMKRAWEQQVNQTAGEIHKKHLRMNAGFSDGYTSALTYSLQANGTADGLGNSTYEGDVKVSVEMSVWKSTPGQVKMDITGGTLTVDGKSIEVHSGYAHYWAKHNRMLVIAFVVEGGESLDNAESNTTNQTTNINQTLTDTTQSSQDYGLDTKVRILKLWLNIQEGSGQFPTNDLGQPVKVEVISPQSKLASMWFLEMSGEVALST
jgi:hypothetical protein